MKKKSLFIIIIDLIVLACFNAIFFINLKESIAQTWLAYSFTTFSFLMIIFTPIFIGKSKSPYLFTVVNTGLAFLYFLINIVVSVISLIYMKFSIKFLLSFYIILTAIYLVFFLLILIIKKKQKDMK